jgi:pyruvate/2-oxoglutarate dehydrogenase complex dihydrolipoamide acyltransferase (E2) component
MEATMRVALPGWVGAGRQKTWATARDVTALIEEWALVLLDPVAALARVAPAALKQPGWDLSGKATVTPAVMRLVREAAADADVERAVAAAVGNGRMMLQGACLLLGLAAVTALDANVGKSAALTLTDLKKRQAAQASAAVERERQRSAKAATRAEAARPTLTPLPDDAWGERVR